MYSNFKMFFKLFNSNELFNYYNHVDSKAQGELLPRKTVPSGGDAMRGKSFLESGVTETTTIADLYEQGFGRTGDTGGIDWWKEEIAAGRHTIKSAAASFRDSEEAQIRDKYADEYA